MKKKDFAKLGLSAAGKVCEKLHKRDDRVTIGLSILMMGAGLAGAKIINTMDEESKNLAAISVLVATMATLYTIKKSYSDIDSYRKHLMKVAQDISLGSEAFSVSCKKARQAKLVLNDPPSTDKKDNINPYYLLENDKTDEVIKAEIFPDRNETLANINKPIAEREPKRWRNTASYPAKVPQSTNQEVSNQFKYKYDKDDFNRVL